MKERPILFSGAMVRAILGGSKTQTRRVIKPQPVRIGGSTVLQWRDGLFQPERLPTNSNMLAHCPHGKPGDRLWVRETWKPSISHGCGLNTCDCSDVWIDYPAGGEGRFIADQDIPGDWMMPQAAQRGNNVPSLHMPRWASRITLEVTGVRVERLQDISEKDAIAEGCKSSIHLPGGRFANENFAHLWWTINGDGSWEANPWVWVVEFRRIEA